ncbi:MAG TPA: CYCXC family (seleno)protein [Acidobacteriaceae bacterium]|nr:CYCXC family (seleno)protein [Acidobacteriaceae bacterium]
MRTVLLTFSIALLTLGASAQWALPTDDVPAYHTAPPAAAAKLPPILAAAQIRAAGATLPWQFQVYALAARVPRVLYQLPCNCRCDRALGHASLLSCFSSAHGMECSTCAQEGVYAYRMTKLGKTPAQIRAGIAGHEYENINLTSLDGQS